VAPHVLQVEALLQHRLRQLTLVLGAAHNNKVVLCQSSGFYHITEQIQIQKVRVEPLK
jgi:hypothetical protein